MKTRMCYVSNSSSSSFIIAYNDKRIEFKSENGGVISLSPHDFYDHLQSCSCSNSESTQLEANGKDNILSAINGWSSYSMPGEKDYYKDLKESIKNSNEENIIMFNISYHDELSMIFLKALLGDGAVRLLHSSEDAEKE